MDKLKDYIKTLLKLAIQNNPEVLNVVRNAKVENDAAFESKHPRKEDGTFTRTNGQSFYNEATKTIELKGDELGSTDEEIRENGLKYFKENYQGKKFDNPELKEILFSNPGIKKFYTSSADIHKIKAIPALKDIIEKGKYQGSEDLAHPRHDGIIKFHRINHNVSIDGHKENMSVLIGEDKNGNKFYNLNHRTYKAENSSRGERAIGVANEEFLINIIPDFNENFNPGAPNMKKHEVQNHKEQDMALLDELKKDNIFVFFFYQHPCPHHLSRLASAFCLIRLVTSPVRASIPVVEGRKKYYPRPLRERVNFLTSECEF